MNGKIGRNDLCPCGSGKKYKKCCANLAEVIEFNSDPWTKSNQMITALKVKLEEQYKQTIKKVRRDAVQKFLRFTSDKTMAPDHEAIFSDWLWFDLIYQGQTIGTDYSDHNDSSIEPVLKQSLAALNQSYLSIYRAEANQGDFLQISDLFTGSHFKILLKEPWEAANMPNILLLGRVVQVMGNNIFSGMVLVMNATDRQEQFLLQHVKHWQMISNHAFTDLFKAHGEILLGLFDHAFHKNLVGLQELYSITLTGQERKALQAGLNSHPDYCFAYQTEGFDWFKPRELKDRYCRIAVGSEVALLSADVLSDIEALLGLAASLFADKHPVLIHSLLMPEMLKPEVTSYWFLVLKDQETERFLITPHQELDNKMPEQILTEADGQKKLLGLLDSFIDSAENEDVQDLLGYMQTRIKQM